LSRGLSNYEGRRKREEGRGKKEEGVFWV